MINPAKVLRSGNVNVEQLLKLLYPSSERHVSNILPRAEFETNFRNGLYSPTYGELTFRGGQELLDHAFRHLPINKKSTLFDLGSGVGKFCIQASITHAKALERVVGIEISPSRHAIALHALFKLGDSSISHSEVNFRCDDLLTASITGELQIIFCASLTFSTHVVTSLSKRLSDVASAGSLVYTFRPFPSSKRLLEYGSTNVETTWSRGSNLMVYKVVDK
jgi:hypothetical protein